MPKKPKSYNRPPENLAKKAALIFLLLGAVSIMLAPQIVLFFVGIDAQLTRLFSLGTVNPSVPRWSLLGGPIELIESGRHVGEFALALKILLPCSAAASIAAVAIEYENFHDGTWLGPRRVDGDPGGSARIISKKRELRRILRPFSPVEANGGLAVAYFDGSYWMLDFVNALVLGAPGSGKSRRVLCPSICANIAAGNSLFVLDPKGELADYSEDLAKSAGYRVVRLCVDDPEHSPDSTNPMRPIIAAFAKGDPDSAIAAAGTLARIICPTRNSSNPHFENSAKSLCEGLVLYVSEDRTIPDDSRNLMTVAALAALVDEDGTTGLMRIREIARRLPREHPAKAKLSQVAGTGDEEAASVVSTFVSKINAFVDARVARMLWRDTFEFESMSREKVAVFLSFTTAQGDYGPLVTSIVSNALAAMRGEAARQGGRLRRDCYFILEEMAQMDRIATLYRDAGIMRGEGCHLLMVLQERSQLLTKYDRNEAASLMGCCDDTLVLSVNELEVARELSGKVGTYAAATRSTSQSGEGPLIALGRRGVTASSQRRELITPDEFLKWGPDIGNLLIGHGGAYAMPSPELSETFVNGMLGLGDAGFNEALRAAKKRERAASANASAPLWMPSPEDARINAVTRDSNQRQTFNPLAGM